MVRRNTLQYGAMVMLVLVCAARADAQPPTRTMPPVLADSLTGRDSYDLYCVSCHGPSGLGDGPIATALKKAPADLTTLTRRNGGLFPTAAVAAALAGTGRAIPAHGTTDMPAWGHLFRAFESDARARVRVDNLVAFLERMQTVTTSADSPGAILFRTYCASCHGADARGSGPLSDLLRNAPPDLTRFAARNGGVFPADRVTRIVDGSDVASHGNREMPVWGDAFTRTSRGLTEQAARARVDALVRYLEGIQVRATD
jgi:mono/diheme cytochrome c family protein